jgi:hypothetical protein
VTEEKDYATLIEAAFEAMHSKAHGSVAMLGDDRGWSFFLRANQLKRQKKLVDRLQGVAGVLPDLSKWASLYATSMPLAVNDSLTADADRFLCWLQDHAALSSGQRDQVLLQRARHVLEQRAGAEREVFSTFVRLAAARHLMTGLDVEVVANPLRETVVLSGQGNALMPVVIYPYANQYRGRSLGKEAGLVLASVSAQGCVTLRNVMLSTGLASSSILTIGASLVECGLAAVATPRAWPSTDGVG